MRERISTKGVLLGIFFVSLILAGVVSFYASGSPDGLTKVSEDQGFASTGTTHNTDGSPLAGYDTSFVDDDRAGKGISGVLGVLVVLVFASGVSFVLVKRKPEKSESAEPVSA